MRNIYKIMIWNQTKECMDREQMRLLQGARLKKLVHRVYHHTPFYRDKMQQMGLTPTTSTRSTTSSNCLSLPSRICGTITRNGLFAAPNRRSSRLHASSGTTRQTHGGRLHAPRSFDLVGVDRTLPDGFRHHARRPVHGRLRLRPFHGRTGSALRGGTPRSDRHPDVYGQYGQAHPTDARLRLHRAGLHAVLRPVPGRTNHQVGYSAQRISAAYLHSRRRTVDRKHAPRDRSEAGRRCVQYIRAQRDHGARSIVRMPLQIGFAHRRRPFLSGNHRFEHVGTAARPAGRASWCSRP